MPDAGEIFDAWNPGLSSEIPPRLMPLASLFRPENSELGYAEAKAAAELCGREPREMAAPRFSRLVVHELLIRVSADLHVPDGPRYGDLGVKMRGMAARVLSEHILPRMPALEAEFTRFRAGIERRLAEILDAGLAPDAPPPSPRRGPLAFLRRAAPPDPPSSEPPEFRALARWRARLDTETLDTETDERDRACLEALSAIVGGIVARRGRLMADRTTVIRLARIRLCAEHGSVVVGRMIAPLITEAAEALGYRFLPAQSAPCVMNVKGASAAGKSSIRPLQRELAGRLGIPWEDFALISPDYWRKFLIDYDALGDDYKYAAMLTGMELEIIDRKLDRYMAEKAREGRIPHLLLDRFRFDSFQTGPEAREGGTLLSRFGQTVYLFFIITPPVDTVERAWIRGHRTGRFKAVEDLLFHNIEANSGMPRLFLSWVNRTGQTIHFEFLDNSVPLGTRPRTVAFGWNGRMVVLDPDCLRLTRAYERVNIHARAPGEVLIAGEAPGRDLLTECEARIPLVDTVDPATLAILRRVEKGVPVFPGQAAPPPPLDAARERGFTIGDWSPPPPRTNSREPLAPPLPQG